MQRTITTFDNTAEGWPASLYAFLAKAVRRAFRAKARHRVGTTGRSPLRAGVSRPATSDQAASFSWCRGCRWRR
jgi:hypothetical protein